MKKIYVDEINEIATPAKDLFGEQVVFRLWRNGLAKTVRAGNKTE